ncbi:Lecithin-cholesterol acyltransferase-like 4 [Ancistrocladus abbreviatus]
MAVLLEEIVQSVEMWLKLLRKSKLHPYVNPDLDPVLLVPGVAGSILHAVDDESGHAERVWVRILGADYKLRTKLWSRFDPSTGKTLSLDPKTSVVVPEDRYGLYAIDILDPDMIIGRECVYYFHDMIIEMIKWGFEEGKTLFGFGYDFRQSNRLQETMDRFATKLESIFTASGGKRMNIISHSMGGILVKCFMSLHPDVFERYVKNWIAIAAPFQGAPGYITSTFLNGMSFVDGWEQNFFISKWSMHQLLIECPSIYELMACPEFHWKHTPHLEIWREKHDDDGNSNIMLESYSPEESLLVFNDALLSNTVDYHGVHIPLPFNLDILKWATETRKILCSAVVPSGVKFYNIYGLGLETPHSVCYGDEESPVKDLHRLRYLRAKYICVDGDGTVPAESAKADGLKAEARVGVPGEHRGILSERHVFRILKHWLKAGEPDPFYDPLNDFVILPTAFELERHKEKGIQITSLKEEWEILSWDPDKDDAIMANNKQPIVSSVLVSKVGENRSAREGAHATLVVNPPAKGKQHVELDAFQVSVNV